MIIAALVGDKSHSSYKVRCTDTSLSATTEDSIDLPSPEYLETTCSEGALAYSSSDCEYHSHDEDSSEPYDQSSEEDNYTEPGNGSSDEDCIDDKMFDPLYENANITLCGTYCALMEYKRACHLPFTAIEKHNFGGKRVSSICSFVVNGTKEYGSI